MVDDKLSNFIPISRKLFEHEFWQEDRSFSKFEAWLDLLQSARYDEDFRSEWINGKEIKYGRGQLIASFRYLQKRWNWGSITKVERFLNVLKNKDMVVSEKGQGINVITICKYESYNNSKKEEKTEKGQRRGRQKDKTNKENNKELSIYYKKLDAFVKMRQKIKKPLTEEGIELIEEKLTKLSNGDEAVKIEILNQSIENSWQGVFEVKSNRNDLFSKQKTTDLDSIEM